MGDAELDEFGYFVERNEEKIDAFFNHYFPNYKTTEHFKDYWQTNKYESELTIKAEYGTMKWMEIHCPHAKKVAQDCETEILDELYDYHEWIVRFYQLYHYSQKACWKNLLGVPYKGTLTLKPSEHLTLLYTGDIIQKQPDGYGVGLYSNENVYRGTWLDGKREGFGEMQAVDWHYKGEYKNNVADGKGFLEYRDGRVLAGDFRARWFPLY